MAIEEINSQGGSRRWAAAKIVLREADAGDRRRESGQAPPNGPHPRKNQCGYWVLAFLFTLGVTEVAERLQVPCSRSPTPTPSPMRGFKYTFQTSPVSSLQPSRRSIS